MAHSKCKVMADTDLSYFPGASHGAWHRVGAQRLVEERGIGENGGSLRRGAPERGKAAGDLIVTGRREERNQRKDV